MKGIPEKIASLMHSGHVVAKMLCLALAIILWVMVSNSKIETLKFKVPIMLKNLPPEVVVSNISDKFATVLLEGRSEDLKNPPLKSVKAVVNLENAVIGESASYPVQIEKQEIPDDIAVLPVTKEITLTIERKEEKWVEVLPSITGSVRPGMIAIEKSVVPERARVSGPRSVINSLQFVETEDVSVSNEAADLELQVGLKKDGQAFKDVVFGEKVFTVKVVISDTKDFIVVSTPVKIRNGARDYEFDIKEPSIEAYVRAKNYQNLNPGDIEAYIDVGRLNIKRTFEEEKISSVTRLLPVVAIGKTINTADIVSINPKKMLIKITRKQN